MTVSSNKPHHSLLHAPVLALFLTVTWLLSSSVTGIAAQIQAKGEVGGNVTFFCPSDKHKKLDFFYLQKGDIFVNGYYASKPYPIPGHWSQTMMDRTERTVHMWGLNVSHSGEYHCHIKYQDGSRVHTTTTTIQLSVTANYSVPTHTVLCSDDNHVSSCLVTCASYGGYPARKVMWNVSETVDAQQWKVVRSSEDIDSHSMLINISSTAYFNCSHELPQSLSCSVVGVTSEKITVCLRKNQLDLLVPSVIAAICVVVFVIFGIILWSCKCRKGNPNESRDTGNPEETIVLNGNKGGVETS